MSTLTRTPVVLDRDPDKSVHTYLQECFWHYDEPLALGICREMGFSADKPESDNLEIFLGRFKRYSDQQRFLRRYVPMLEQKAKQAVLSSGPAEPSILIYFHRAHGGDRLYIKHLEMYALVGAGARKIQISEFGGSVTRIVELKGCEFVHVCNKATDVCGHENTPQLFTSR